MDRLLRRVIGEQVDLVVNLDPALGATRVDATQFEQVIVNLAVNARDAMPKGGKLTLETRNVELDASYAALHADAKPGRYVMMAVSDNGVGMDETTRALIFEPFFSTKDRTKGTGLGLATVYGIVHQAGGHIWVYSEPGRGATFKVYLPRIDQAVDAVHAPQAASPAPRGSETILLVEDDWQVRDLLAAGLKAQGYTLIVASDGQEALDRAAAARIPVDILVTDVVLPVLSGPEVAARLTETMPNLPVLFMSGYAEDAVVHQGVVDAGVAFLSKPFSVADLGRRIRDILQHPTTPS
jgi:CheY-like chemotaxis protein